LQKRLQELHKVGTFPHIAGCHVDSVI
jgi:hypothetical protein